MNLSSGVAHVSNLCCSLTCRLPRAHHLPHALFLPPRHKNTKNTQNIPHISKHTQATSCAIKNHSGVKTCSVAETRARLLPQKHSKDWKACVFTTSACLKHSLKETFLCINHNCRKKTISRRESLCVHHRRMLEHSPKPELWLSIRHNYARTWAGGNTANAHCSRSSLCKASTSNRVSVHMALSSATPKPFESQSTSRCSFRCDKSLVATTKHESQVLRATFTVGALGPERPG